MDLATAIVVSTVIFSLVVVSVGGIIITLMVLTEKNTQKDRDAMFETLATIHSLVNSRLTVALATGAALKRTQGLPLLEEEVLAEAEVELLRHRRAQK